jgi:hypothetical protein
MRDGEEGMSGDAAGEKEARKRCRRFEFISPKIKQPWHKVREGSDTLSLKQPERVFIHTFNFCKHNHDVEMRGRDEAK